MKIVNKSEFYQLPAGTLYCNYKPCIFYDLHVKGDTIYDEDKNPVDFIYESLVGNIKADSSDEFFTILNNVEAFGNSIELDFDCSERDGLYEDEQLFAIYEQKDIDGFIEKLKTCKGL